MKKQICFFSFKLTLIGCIVILFNADLFGQLKITPDGNFGVSPGPRGSSGYSYQTSDFTNYLGCMYDWTVTNGVIVGGTMINGTSTYTNSAVIYVQWNNSTSNGTIRLKSYNCSDPAKNQNILVTYHILSINGVTPGTIFGQAKVPYNASTCGSYSCATLVYPNRGVGDPLIHVDSYKWLIPEGWSLNGQVSDGVTPFINLTNTITPLPDKTSSGTIKVWGHSNLGLGYDSNPSTLGITRTSPVVTISASNTNSCIQGDRTPITLSIAQGGWSWAQYNWTIPATWQLQGKSTTSSIIVIPDGCLGGNVSCTITVQNSAPVTASKLYSNFPQYSESAVPYIYGSSTICSSTTPYTIVNLPANTSTITWNQSSNITPSSGQNTNTYNLQSNGTGSGWVQATINSSCGSSKALSVPVWVGPPIVNSITGPSSIGTYLPVNYYTEIPSGNAFPDDYFWGTSPLPTTITSHGDYANIMFTAYQNYQVVTRVHNACGWGDYVIKMTSVNGGYYLNITPNPESSEAEISIASASKEKVNAIVEWDVEVFNQGQQLKDRAVRLQDKKHKINTQGWKNGIYIVRAKVNGETVTGKLIIKK